MPMQLMTSKIVEVARSWIGTPYHHQASLKGTGCDCLGLVRGVWREVTGQDHEKLPPYSPDWGEVNSRETLYEGAAQYLLEVDLTHPVRSQRITRTQEGDVVLFRMKQKGIAKHCGFVAFKDGQRTLIHAATSYPVSEVPFDFAWCLRLAYAFRFPGVEPKPQPLKSMMEG